MTPLLWRSSLRHLVRHPWQFGLAVLGVALGVAVVVSIDLANASASRAFTLSTEAITGRATHQVAGGPEGLPDDTFRRLVLETGIPAAPVVEGYVLVPGRDGKPRRILHVLGIDPFSERPFRPYLGTGAGGAREQLVRRYRSPSHPSQRRGALGGHRRGDGRRRPAAPSGCALEASRGRSSWRACWSRRTRTPAMP